MYVHSYSIFDIRNTTAGSAGNGSSGVGETLYSLEGTVPEGVKCMMTNGDARSRWNRMVKGMFVALVFWIVMIWGLL
jgi:hypothetical protein